MTSSTLGSMWRRGLSSGWRAIRAGRINKESIRLSIVPLNYWRMAEIPRAVSLLAVARPNAVLNVASPFLSSIALQDEGVEVTTIDIQDSAVSHQNSLIQCLDLNRQRSIAMDARRLVFDAESFDRVLAISSIEHIPDAGDTEAITEIARVLKPGGQAVITVPYVAGPSYDEYRGGPVYERDGGSGQTFFQRYYSAETLNQRLIQPSGLKCKAIEYVYERKLGKSPTSTLWTRLNHPKYLKPVFEILSPLLYPIFHLTRPEKGNPIVAMMVLEK
jgi:ubiquinone/menaquinone biosynthesis C-methylase UbiE